MPQPRIEVTSRARDDVIILTVVGAIVFVLSAALDVFGHLALWLHDQQLVDDLVSFVLIVVIAFGVFTWRRLSELREARETIRMLSGVIHVCAWCRRARGHDEAWIPLEDYVRRESAADGSPDLCPDCERRTAPGKRRGFF